MDGIFKGEAAQPPTFCHSNAYGKFVFRAYWLDKFNRDPGGLVGISIEHHEPQALAVMRALRFFGLSANQNQVALLLCQGLNNEEIGRKMHVKRSTVIDHIRKIFTKLDIHKREELLPKLMALANQSLQNRHLI